MLPTLPGWHLTSTRLSASSPCQVPHNKPFSSPCYSHWLCAAGEPWLMQMLQLLSFTVLSSAASNWEQTDWTGPSKNVGRKRWKGAKAKPRVKAIMKVKLMWMEKEIRIPNKHRPREKNKRRVTVAPIKYLDSKQVQKNLFRLRFQVTFIFWGKSRQSLKQLVISHPSQEHQEVNECIVSCRLSLLLCRTKLGIVFPTRRLGLLTLVKNSLSSTDVSTSQPDLGNP